MDSKANKGLDTILCRWSKSSSVWDSQMLGNARQSMHIRVCMGEPDAREILGRAWNLRQTTDYIPICRCDLEQGRYGRARSSGNASQNIDSDAKLTIRYKYS